MGTYSPTVWLNDGEEGKLPINKDRLNNMEAGIVAATRSDNNLDDLDDAETARTNLGLGDAATADFGTGEGDVAEGDHGHTLADISDAGTMAAEAAADYAPLAGATFTGPVHFDNADDETRGLVLDRSVAAGGSAVDIFQVKYRDIRQTWTNEKGNLRTSNANATDASVKAEDAFKVIGATDGTGNYISVVKEVGDPVWRVGSAGRVNYYFGSRLVGDTIQFRDSSQADESTMGQVLSGALDISAKRGVRIANSTASAAVLTLKGADSQSGNALEVRNSSDVLLSSITASGKGLFSNIGPTSGNFNILDSGGGIGIQVRTTDVTIPYRLYASNGGSVDAFVATGNSRFTVSNAAHIPTIVRGYTAQSANLTEWQNSSATVLASISSGGAGTFAGLTVSAGYDINAAHAAAGNTRYGTGALRAAATGINNTVIGATAGDAITSGAYNVLLGHNAGGALTTGGQNVALGTDSLGGAASTNSVAVGMYALSAASAAENTAVGYASLFGVTSGTNNIAIGTRAGRYSTTQSNELFINSLDRTNRAGDIASSIIYGVQNATASSQTLALNAVVTATYGLKWPSALEQTTVGAAGGASALPATPTKYLQVIDSTGTPLVIAAYAAS